MRVYTRRLLVSFLALILGASVVACGGDTTTDIVTPNDSVIPNLSNPDQIFLQNDIYTVTYGDLYDVVKVNDGLNQLLLMVDSALLADYFAAVTDEEIAERTEKLIYGTNDQEIINNLTDDEKADFEKAYYDGMYMMGFADNPEDYVRVVVVRENYAIDLMLDEENSEEAWYTGPTAVAEYYDAQYDYDINTIKIRFLSEADAKSVMRLFNLVSLGGELKLYTGITPLDQVPSTALNETNTVSLTDEQILEKFIQLYNYIYGSYRDELAEDATLEGLLANEDLIVSRDTLTKANTSLDNFVYDTLGSYEAYIGGEDTKLYYTYAPVKYYSSSDTSYYMILNLAKTEKVDVTDFAGTEADLVSLIGQDIYDELQNEIIQTNLNTSSFVSARIIELRQAHSFNIYDYFIGVDYQAADNDFVLNEEGDASIVASYDDVNITADELFTYAMNVNAPMYVIYASQAKAAIAAHYADVYCLNDEVCEYDVTKNKSEKMLEHYDDLASLEIQFDASYYASYYTFDEYLYLAYGVRSRTEMISDYYVISTLQPLFIYDQITKDNYDILNYLMELAQPYYDNYFSLNVDHLLIYVDRDENGTPDDYNDFYAGLEDQAAYDLMLESFDTAIRNYLDVEDNTFDTLITEYNKASRADAVWGEFKLYGFNIITESLGEVTYLDSVGVYEDSFVDSLIAIYQQYKTEAYENEDYIYYDSLIESSYGRHIVRAEKGTSFERPSALFTMTYDDDNVAEYLPGMVNLTDPLSFEQLKIYADYRFTVVAYGNGDFESIYGLTRPDIPSSVNTAIKAFYDDLYDALYVVGYMNYIIIDQLLDSTITNEYAAYCSMSTETINERLAEIQNIYMYQIFADLDVR